MLAPAFWMLHAALGPAMRSARGLAMVHVGIVVLVALYVALAGRRVQAVYLAGYIVGCEVLWRMNGSRPYELGKFLIAALLFAMIWRMGRPKMAGVMVAYLALLVPSVVATYSVLGPTMVLKENLSFTLSGPLALAICVVFFSNIQLTETELWRTAFCILNPILGVMMITITSTYTGDVNFGTSSNAMTSGGFGPNQVAGILGFGALLPTVYLLRAEISLFRKAMVASLVVALLVQSAMTFSRGGIYAALGALLPALFFLLRDRGKARVLMPVVLIAGVIAIVVVPALDDFTGGALLRRFEDTRTTGRMELMEEDMDMWMQNPLFGVGVGMSDYGHYSNVTSHNEFTRLLSEHGLLGLIALIVLFGVFFQNFSRARTPMSKAFVTSVAGWGMLFMVSSAMRIAAPAYAFGLACATLTERRATVQRQRPRGAIQRYP